jgi:hypothetical protein
MNRTTKRLVTLNLALLAFIGCSDADQAKRHLHNAGYSNVVTTGYAFGACSKDDTYSTGFRGVGPTGNYTEGAVCCGLFLKGCTIRFQ